MTKLADMEVPSLEGGWVTLAEAADRLGYTRSYAYKKASSNGFQTLHSIGSQASYVVNESEILDILEERSLRKVSAAEDEPKPKRARKKAEGVEPVTEEPEQELSLEEILSRI
jgi:hypothetical protein